MRLLIVGQKWLAAELVKAAMTDGHEVIGVAAPSPDDRVAATARALGIPVAVAVRRLDAGEVPEGTDLIVAAHAHCFIRSEARAQARLGAIGYHPSLLPRHRGRDSVRWTIAMRDPVAGGTIYWLDDGADTGPIALQDWCHVQPDDDAVSLWRRELAPMGLRLLRRAVVLAAEGALPKVAQDRAVATWEPAFDVAPLSTLS